MILLIYGGTDVAFDANRRAAEGGAKGWTGRMLPPFNTWYMIVLVAPLYQYIQRRYVLAGFTGTLTATGTTLRTVTTGCFRLCQAISEAL